MARRTPAWRRRGKARGSIVQNAEARASQGATKGRADTTDLGIAGGLPALSRSLVRRHQRGQVSYR
ncbi:hypothetical protein GCM10023237_07600 [Streptomyces coeruleoprunus]